MTPSNNRLDALPRRAVLAGGSALALLALVRPQSLHAQQSGALPFSFDTLTEEARQRAAAPSPAPEEVAPLFAAMNYDEYNHIAYRPARARWALKDVTWRLMPFHLGWLFKEPVRLYEVADGQAREITYTSDDFEYRGTLKDRVPAGTALPGVAGFKLTHPMNQGDKMDEIVSFIGASYFRALGQGNAYGLSARGLAIDSGLPKAEEFPRFSGFWIEKPAAGATEMVIYAALDSASVTGAYRFVVRPGVETTVDVTARLFFRQEVEQLGVAPLTSMFLFADVNRLGFNDYRPRVHDSNGLRIVREDGDVIWRALDNPRALSSSYFAETRPKRFGLHQRGRDFDDYQDSGARYDLRPSVDIEPVGDWGTGKVRLFELPTEVEVHDNIGAFWVPDTPVKAGDAREFAYRMHWGRLEPDFSDDLAIVTATRSGIGGSAGNEEPPDTQKFVVDFEGGLLGRTADGDREIAPVLTVENGAAENITLSKLPDGRTWRLVFDIRAEAGALVEMNAHVAGFGRKLTEIWSFQWGKA
ncbi:MAG: glucan biosynthesis protein G [Rhodobacteraceae bacterium]|nr:glucan biosynthesis protein G [Paracoccaceae bacterium]